jgi:hypothetical protein
MVKVSPGSMNTPVFFIPEVPAGIDVCLYDLIIGGRGSSLLIGRMDFEHPFIIKRDEMKK